MKRTATATFLLAACLALPTAATAQREPPERPPIPALTVSGDAEVRVAPDEASVRLGITRRGESASRVQESVNQVAQAILEAITRLGIPREQIQTSRLTLTPIYAPMRPGESDTPRIVGYQASNLVTVRSERLSLIGPIIDAGLRAGANQVEGVSFALREELPARERALRQAAEEARRKAQTLAQSLDVRLAGVLEVQEGGVSIRPPMPFAGAEVAMARAAETPVAPGEVSVYASVVVRYRIEPR